MDYKETYHDSDTSITIYVPVYDYIVSIMRYSVMGAFVGLGGRRTSEDKQCIKSHINLWSCA